MPANDHLPPVEFDDEPPRPPRRRVQEPSSGRPILYLLVLALGLGLGVVVLWGGGKLLQQLGQNQPPVTNPDAKPKEAAANPPLDRDEAEANKIFEENKPSVVNVDTIMHRRAGINQLLEMTGTGSGFIWDTEGRIVTNFHVVEEYVNQRQQFGDRSPLTIRVVLSDRSAFEARIVGTAPNFDLAVIQIAAPQEKLKPIQLATSSDLQVGQTVFAIGNPFGLSLSMTKGIISALDRTIESDKHRGAPITGAIQHQAPINPGNSGGPLLNRFGKLVGVNTSITTPSGGNVGIGFAIPSDTVNRVVTEIVRTGRTYKPDLGVRLYDESRLRRAGYETGVMIAEVIPGGPAAQAGLHGIRRIPGTNQAEPGDVILAINGEKVDGVDDYQRILSKFKPGDRVSVRYLRNEEEATVELTLQGI